MATFVLEVHLCILFVHATACISLFKKFVWTQSRDFLDIAVTWIASLTGVYSCTECFPFSYDVSFRSQLKLLCIEKQVKAFDWALHCGSLTFWRLWKTYSLCFSFMNHVLFPFVLMAGKNIWTVSVTEKTSNTNSFICIANIFHILKEFEIKGIDFFGSCSYFENVE